MVRKKKKKSRTVCAGVSHVYLAVGKDAGIVPVHDADDKRGHFGVHRLLAGLQPENLRSAVARRARQRFVVSKLIISARIPHTVTREAATTLFLVRRTEVSNTCIVEGTDTNGNIAFFGYVSTCLVERPRLPLASLVDQL